MAGLPCSVRLCPYNTDDQVPSEQPFADKLALLKIHADSAHVLPQQAPVAAHPKVKLDPPKLSAGSDQETWEHFLRNWSMFKTGMGITHQQAPVYMFNCLDSDLKDDILRANPSTEVAQMTEHQLTEIIKTLAVKIESKLVHRIRMGQTTQPPGSSIRNFQASLKGQSKLCQFKVQCPTCQVDIDYSEEVILDQLVRGIGDKEILSDLLGDTKTDRSLSEVVDFIARKEQAKLEQGTVSFESASAVKQLPATPVRSGAATTCWACQQPSHGPNTFKTRQDKCSAWSVTCDKCSTKGHITKACTKCVDCNAWGHKSKKSKKCPKTVKNESAETAILTHNLSLSFIGSQLEGVFTTQDISLATIGNKKGRAVPLTHHIFDKERGWLAKSSAPHPSILASASPCPNDHRDFGHPVNDPGKLHSVKESVIADTGCQSTAIPASFAYKAGFKRKDFIPVVSKMNGAGRSDLGVQGAVVMEFTCVGQNSQTYSTKQLCYVCDRVDRVYLSRQGLADLNCISSHFPVPAPNPEVAAAEHSQEEDCQCNCPPRSSQPPPLPTELPPGVEHSSEHLKTWLLNYYSSTAFNICEHQQLPMMTGSPLQLHLDASAPSSACHKVVPVPIHWRDQVKADLERDVRLKVLEKVPDNTPVTWQARMVITAKSNGNPRRTIDFQSLNRHSSRQTFPVDSPFSLASRIPTGKKKSVVDAWNGYHLVPLHPDYRHCTTFLTPWGRFRYLVAPQGHLVSGDGFNERYDAITYDFKRKERCVDDTVMWADDIQDSFLQMCQYLDLCARNGIVLNPQKFQFCQDVVNFAGLQVTSTNVRPSEKLLDAIKNFPTPKDITGARAFFGLVNQGAYAFAMTVEMAPFRHLLQPKVKFEWTEELDHLFEKSKVAIVNKIIEGVCLFDPNLTTCLATDFSANGLGFFLLQKTCCCPSRSPTCCTTGWRLCLIGSRFLHSAESRYAPIEGEALAVAYGLHQCRYFVLGCKDLIVATDHKPLLHVLNDRSLADIQNRRLQNLKEKTLSYRFSIVHVPGKKHLGPDAASRYPVGPPVRLELPGEPAETEFDDFPSTAELRAYILEGLAILGEEDSEDAGLISDACRTLASITISDNVPHPNFSQGFLPCTSTLATASQSNIVVTWADVQAASANDTTTQEIFTLLSSGFPSDGRSLSPITRPYFPYSSSMYELDGVLMMSDRIVVPVSLRHDILQLLHAAHQGIDRMKSRAGDTVFWPGMVGDISRTRWECQDCHKMAKSNPTQPPHPPPEPEYPFQYLAADYFHHGGKNYVVVVDRYSHWPSVFSAELGSKGLIINLRTMFSTYGIPEEIASDGGPEFTAGDTQSFFKTWGVHHRLSSVAFPHSNCRAELAVKQVKRIITSNCSPSGSLDVDKFHKAILSYRNTPDPVTKFSPAMAVFGREMRDGLPILPGKYNPHTCWKELLEYREKGMAKRHVAQSEAWSEHTRKLVPLHVGDKVFLQNQIGHNPRRWERTGIILESKDYDQYLVKVDGTGRATLRNRKFLRKYTPITNPTNVPPPSPVTTPGSPTSSRVPSVIQPAAPTPPPTRVDSPPLHNSPSLPVTVAPNPSLHAPGTLFFPSPQVHYEDVPIPHVQSPPNQQNYDDVHDPPVVPPSHQQSTTPRATSPVQPTSTRPKRNVKPSCKLDPDVWDLSRVNLSSTPLTMEWCLELIKWIADNANVSSKLSSQEDSPGGGR